jgi:hypothetical protein
MAIGPHADLLLRALTGDQAADLLEVIEAHARLRSNIVTSQLAVAPWHQAVGVAATRRAIGFW